MTIRTYQWGGGTNAAGTAIPARWLAALELREEIERLAGEL